MSKLTSVRNKPNLQLICHWNIDYWKQKISFEYVMVPKMLKISSRYMLKLLRNCWKYLKSIKKGKTVNQIFFRQCTLIKTGHLKRRQKYIKNFISEKIAFYPIIWHMNPPKNIEKIVILKVWQLVSFWGVKTNFGKLALKWGIFKHEKIKILTNILL